MTNTPIAGLEIETPLGPFVICATEAGLSHCQPEGSASLPEADAKPSSAASAVLERAANALHAYFQGEKDPWHEVPLAPTGTDFQHCVWSALREIPYGQTLSYRDLALRAGQPRAARAVGQANHHNPLAIVVPCHRVIAADGSLGGYAGGLERKRWLLEHEGALPQRQFATMLNA